MSRGLFISFEGIDGIGKSRQIAHLASKLSLDGHDVLVTKEPGDENAGSNIGAGIRHLLFKEPGTGSLRPGVADMLFLADHIQTAGDIKEAVVEQGKIVICDRYADSQFAYATGQMKKCPQWALDAYQANYGIVPDATVLLVARGPWIVPTELVDPEKRTNFLEDISWALERAKSRGGAEAGKQEGKVWGNSVEEQRKIQDAYIERLGPLDRTIKVHVHEDTSIWQVHHYIVQSLRQHFRYTFKLWAS